MTSARDTILARIRAANLDHPAVAVPRDYRGAGGLHLADPVVTFVERVQEYRASVHRCAAADVSTTIQGRLARRTGGGAATIVPAGFPAGWLPDGLVPVEGRPTTAELDRAGAVLTTCAIAIALTGTIVLDHGPGQGPRALTLVPDFHLAVVRADQIVPGVPDALAHLGPTATQTWISGPSATSDIELDRVEGVHGPRTLEVIVVETTAER